MSCSVKFSRIERFESRVNADLVFALGDMMAFDLWEQAKRGEVLVFSFSDGDHYVGCAAFHFEDVGAIKVAVARHVIGHTHGFIGYCESLLSYLGKNCGCHEMRVNVEYEAVALQRCVINAGFLPLETVYFKKIGSNNAK